MNGNGSWSKIIILTNIKLWYYILFFENLKKLTLKTAECWSGLHDVMYQIIVSAHWDYSTISSLHTVSACDSCFTAMTSMAGYAPLYGVTCINWLKCLYLYLKFLLGTDYISLICIELFFSKPHLACGVC